MPEEAKVRDWDGAAQLMDDVLDDQAEAAPFLVEEEEYFFRPIEYQNIEEVKKMLDQINARYEVDARHLEVYEEA